MSMRFGPAAILTTAVVSFGLAWVISDEVKGQKKQEQATRPRDAVRVKSKVMDMQRKLLASRYNLEPKLDAEVKMSRGKPLCVGPTARLKEGMTWEKLAELSPEDVRDKGLFPYPSLPHPKQTP